MTRLAECARTIARIQRAINSWKDTFNEISADLQLTREYLIDLESVLIAEKEGCEEAHNEST